MKIRLLVGLIALSVALGTVFSQAQRVQAISCSGSSCPLTSPISFFQISGRIFRRVDHNKIKAVKKVTVSAGPYSTQTDQYGNYSLNVAPGVYDVTPQKKNLHFVPSSQNVDASSGSVSGVNFEAVKKNDHNDKNNKNKGGENDNDDD